MTIAFDMDGTLISCKNRQIEVLRVIMNSSKIFRADYDKFDYNSWWSLKRAGKNTHDSLVHMGVLPEEAAIIDYYWKAKIENIEFLYIDMLNYGVRECMRQLRAEHHKLLIITGRTNKDNLRLETRRLRLETAVDLIYCVNPFHAATEKSVILKSEVIDLFIGDSETDLQAAQKAGIPFMAFTGGQRDAEFLMHKGASYLFDDFNKLINIINSR